MASSSMIAKASDLLLDIASQVEEVGQENPDLLTDEQFVDELLNPLLERLQDLKDVNDSLSNELTQVKRELAVLKPPRQEVGTDQPVLLDQEIKIYRLVKKSNICEKNRVESPIDQRNEDTGQKDESQIKLMETEGVDRRGSTSNNTNKQTQDSVAGNDASEGETTNHLPKTVTKKGLENTSQQAFDDEQDQEDVDDEDYGLEFLESIHERNNQVPLTELNQLYQLNLEEETREEDTTEEDGRVIPSEVSTERRESQASNSSLTNETRVGVTPYSQSPGLLSWRTKNASNDVRLPPRSYNLNVIRRLTSRGARRPQASKDYPRKKSEKPDVREVLKSSLKALLSILRAKDVDKIFHYPVDTSIVTDYLVYIKRPMDFLTMERKINDGSYSSLKDFVLDFNLIISNCECYNDPDTIFHQFAQKLREEAKPLIESTEKQIKAAAGEDVEVANRCPCPVHDPMGCQRRGRKPRCIIDPANNFSLKDKPYSPESPANISRPSSSASNSGRRRRRAAEKAAQYLIESDVSSDSESNVREIQNHLLQTIPCQSSRDIQVESDTDHENSRGGRKDEDENSQVNQTKDQPEDDEVEPFTPLEESDGPDEEMELINPFTGEIETSSVKASVDELKRALEEKQSDLIETTETGKNIVPSTPDKSSFGETSNAVPMNTPASGHPPVSHSSFNEQVNVRMTRSKAHQMQLQQFTPVTTSGPCVSLPSPSSFLPSTSTGNTNWNPNKSFHQIKDQSNYNNTYASSYDSSLQHQPFHPSSSLENQTPQISSQYFEESSTSFASVDFNDLNDERIVFPEEPSIDVTNPLGCRCPKHDTGPKSRGRPRKRPCLYSDQSPSPSTSSQPKRPSVDGYDSLQSLQCKCPKHNPGPASRGRPRKCLFEV